MVDVSTEIVIGRPAAEVARFAMNPDNAPRWYVNIEAVDWRSPKPLGVASRIAFVARFLGRRLAYTYEVVELVPDRRLRMRTADGPFPMETTYDFEPLSGASCRMRLRNRGRPRGFGSLVSPFIALAMRHANRKDLVRIRTLLEGAA
jgi:uncharacterized membrane protein